MKNNLKTLINEIFKKRITPFLALVLVSLIIVYTVNWFFVQRTLSRVLLNDDRNTGLEINTYYDNSLNFNKIVFDLHEFKENSSADVMRVFIQFSEAMKNRDFDRVYLAYRGEKKFFVQGTYFKNLGQEADHQNPTYTIRTLPENIYNIDGTQAYQSHRGGMLYVVTAQMEDFSDFTKKWFINDFVYSEKVKNEKKEPIGEIVEDESAL